jgi:general stress protein 26
MSNSENLEQNIEKFIKLIKNTRVCMLISDEKDEEYLSGRPMAISDVDENGNIWFFTKERFHWVDELEENKMVSLAIINESDNTYLMVHGDASLSDDQEKMKELWNPSMKAWYPKGLDEQDIILLKVTPEDVHYWDNDSNNMVVLFKMVKAILKGEEFSGGEQGEMNNETP